MRSVIRNTTQKELFPMLNACTKLRGLCNSSEQTIGLLNDPPHFWSTRYHKKNLVLLGSLWLINSWTRPSYFYNSWSCIRCSIWNLANEILYIIIKQFCLITESASESIRINQRQNYSKSKLKLNCNVGKSKEEREQMKNKNQCIAAEGWYNKIQHCIVET